jgi:hypothetical protein
MQGEGALLSHSRVADTWHLKYLHVQDFSDWHKLDKYWMPQICMHIMNMKPWIYDRFYIEKPMRLKPILALNLTNKQPKKVYNFVI